MRASARVFAIHTAGIIAILGVSAASLPEPAIPYAERADAAANAFAAQIAANDSRIQASAAADYEFDTIHVGVTELGLAGQTWTGPLPASVKGNKVLMEAAKYQGVPYVWGGRSPAGFDCVGFVGYVYQRLGINLPRTTGPYFHIGKRVSRKNARPGDIVVTPGHVALYAGGNLVIEAATKGTVVRFRTMWQKNPVFVRVTKDKFWEK